MKKAIFLDIDGTLIDSLGGLTEISPKVEKEIRMLQEKGVYVFVATGRPYAFINKSLLEFGFDGFILTNGAQVMINNETICSKPMGSDFINQLVSTLEEKGIQYVLEDDKHAYMKASHKAFYQFYDSVGIGKECFISDYNLEKLNVYKVEIMCPNEEVLNQCVAFINQHSEYGYFQSIDEIHLEVYFKENTKAAGIIKATEYLNISIENTYAFGDGRNDIEMLDIVGCGIAMGNASDEVKQYANVVTDTVHNDGVAVGIRKYIYDNR